MTISYSAPRLEGDDYATFVELALAHPRWGMGYTYDGRRLMFTAAHTAHDVGLACHDLGTFADLIARFDRCVANTPRERVRPYLVARERAHAAREARDVAALMDLSTRLGRAEIHHVLSQGMGP
ncbi:hypothetical protein O4J56_13420 [Nocardiopsis sp. RSe5-2]|uniref:Uncharacterized protein n=1 Tax=Nocardiopsis endophytica TaxID=3018445 RepID=A0ABT4U3X4_9ACTN|nr:hypothetical protein [Nocardiopsis endophytica]MDA2811635.1 hypothetical protein [Nocardiopsis endophytica]